jgi:hypothetical protein
VNFWFGKLFYFCFEFLYSKVPQKYFYKCYFLMYFLSFCHEFCRRQICKYSGRTITQNGFDLHYFIPSYAIANRGSTWGIIPTIPPIIQRLEVDVLGPKKTPCGFKYKFSSSRITPGWTVTVFLWDRKRQSWNNLKHPQQYFPLFVLPMRYLQFLEWEKFLFFSKTHQCNNILICFW